MVGWIAYAALIVPLAFLIATHRAAGDSPASIGLQLAGIAVIVWARLTFGWRSFHAGSTATAGGLVTSGPHRFVRHPIYGGVLVMLAGALVAHHDWPAFVAAAASVIALGVRVVSEERQVTARYPVYAEYARRTCRLIPWLF